MGPGLSLFSRRPALNSKTSRERDTPHETALVAIAGGSDFRRRHFPRRRRATVRFCRALEGGRAELVADRGGALSRRARVRASTAIASGVFPSNHWPGWRTEAQQRRSSIFQSVGVGDSTHATKCLFRWGQLETALPNHRLKLSQSGRLAPVQMARPPIARELPRAIHPARRPDLQALLRRSRQKSPVTSLWFRRSRF